MTYTDDGCIRLSVPEVDPSPQKENTLDFKESSSTRSRRSLRGATVLSGVETEDEVVRILYRKEVFGCSTSAVDEVEGRVRTQGPSLFFLLPFESPTDSLRIRRGSYRKGLQSGLLKENSITGNLDIKHSTRIRIFLPLLLLYLMISGVGRGEPYYCRW